MLDPEMKQRRLALLESHFKSEVNKEFDVTLDTFAEQAHYEIMPTGEVYDTDDSVRAYHVRNRTAFPDQRHENVRYHFSDDDSVTAEFDLLGTNLGEFFGLPPTGKSYRIPVIAVFFFKDELITCERVYFDAASLVRQIGRGELLGMG